MELEDIYRQDLSLLIALQILVEECSVTQAAKRLHLSQSATSRILARLREMLNDPLFTRVGQKLVATQFALDCYSQLQQPTGQLIELLTPKEFSPSECQQKFTIAATDYAMQALVPFMLPEIYSKAPNIKLEVIPVQHKELQSQLSLQGADLAICRAISQTQQLSQQVLGKVGVSCLLSPEHPLADSPLTLDDYLHYPHATIAISDGVKSLVDAAISLHPDRNELLRTSHLDCALALLKFHDLIITLPEGMAELAASKHRLRLKPLPFQIPELDYNLFWHSKSELDKAHKWLREEITASIRQLLKQ
ncbi:LysR family transcriptional regulator [Shewanella eurypsychrophilus]|uniref:LysR family transcriptional regulator n=1 Tax=Shewanella eurypsychrophilus TaxID=2593656 RepID=A0ABX6V348_9GAMM|nr:MULTISPECIES: LysR family transcriptional regulator [Shewanella]QFU20673.1 LysR family transcriptional regulator [Shewanella sp. YLB-09]QFU20953.1 LysR family transcriptional regulator [Shewanella sp. YLB-09]QPG56241.1 LysR family transcriptional regulator [Shewanella eurypsychrophilus]